MCSLLHIERIQKRAVQFCPIYWRNMMHLARLYIYAAYLLGAYLVLPQSIKYHRGDWKLDRIRCSNASACLTHYCNIKLKSARVQHLNVGCEFVREHNNIGTRLKLFYKRTRYVPFLIDVNIEYCSFMAANSRDRNPMARALLPLFTKYSNINHTCPLSGWMYMKDAPLERWLVMGAQMPVGKYRVDFHMYHTETLESMFLIQIWLSVLP